MTSQYYISIMDEYCFIPHIHDNEIFHVKILDQNLNTDTGYTFNIIDMSIKFNEYYQTDGYLFISDFMLKNLIFEFLAKHYGLEA